MVSSKGKIVWIGIRPARKAALISVENVNAIAGYGLEGDHYKKKGSREITIIQQEHLDKTGEILDKNVDPKLTRRNIVVKGITDLSQFQNQIINIGDAKVQITGPCNPCSRMNENLGEGGLKAMSGHGGITGKIIKTGEIKVGDEIVISE